MFRFVFPMLFIATPLVAQDKEQLCATSAEIAGLAVVERVAGEESAKTIKAITADLDGDKANYAGAVQPIVEWVYTLPEDQLSDEVATAYAAACLAQ